MCEPEEERLFSEKSNDELLQALQDVSSSGRLVIALTNALFALSFASQTCLQTLGYNVHFWLLLPLVLYSIGVGSVWRWRMRKSERLLRALVQRREGFAIGTLVEIAMQQSGNLNKSPLVEQAIYDLLPHLTPEVFQTFTDSQVSACITITNQFRKRLCLPMLDALERCGDQRALRKMQSLLFQPVNLSGLNEEAKAARERCLNAIQVRADVETHGASLLRPASAQPSTASAELLRAASATASITPENELLRSNAPPTEAAPTYETASTIHQSDEEVVLHIKPVS